MVLLDTEEGGVTSTASSALNFPTNIKKVNRRKATSHMGVISTEVLPLFILALAIFYYLISVIRFNIEKIP
jgi:hypothetical protein